VCTEKSCISDPSVRFRLHSVSSSSPCSLDNHQYAAILPHHLNVPLLIHYTKLKQSSSAPTSLQANRRQPSHPRLCKTSLLSSPSPLSFPIPSSPHLSLPPCPPPGAPQRAIVTQSAVAPQLVSPSTYSAHSRPSAHHCRPARCHGPPVSEGSVPSCQGILWTLAIYFHFYACIEDYLQRCIF
jgi:hypothetical protein